MNKRYALLGILLMLLGCASQGHESASAAVGAAKADMADSAAAPSTPAAKAPKNPMPRKVIYKGEVTLVSENLDKAADQLETRVKQIGAYVGDAHRTGVRGQTREATWDIRVPADEFDALVKYVCTLGELQGSSRNAEDVSEEYYDAESRLKNKKVEEERLVDLLRRDTGKLTDIITVEHELTRVREEAEVIEGRIRFLSNQVALSTLTVTIREVKNFSPEGPPSLGVRISRSFGGSVDALGELATGGLLALVALLPWVLCLGMVGSVGLWLWRRSRLPKV